MAPPYQDAADGKITSVAGAASGVRPRYLLRPALRDSSPPQPCPTHVQSGQLMEMGNKERELHAAAMFLSADIAARLLYFLSAVDSHCKIFCPEAVLAESSNYDGSGGFHLQTTSCW